VGFFLLVLVFGSPFARPDPPGTLPGNERKAAANVRLYRRFLDLREGFYGASFCAVKAFPKTGRW